ncbi:tRNA(Met) cytidine acetyltransferase TmcA [Nissabacter sp. SGAir0207]|uniref:tRNA(Met) cytidine acetyltransferase TmcA n=1 Tax=Nissabacter sp. SGAir0207 TaxID=2126321 RepID=UPI001F0ED6D4|nr:GNAT family N-acetyltransferase [Nissabacter sp. SGAir0207]
MREWVEAQRAMQHAGIRRLLVISGERAWCVAQAQALMAALAQEVLWISADPALPGALPPEQARQLLGSERQHAVFDACDGLAADALAALAGSLAAGSWLLLLVPPWQRWPQQPDRDTLRWSEQPQPIATPHFVTHLGQLLLQERESLLWRQGEPLRLPDWHARPAWQPPQGEPTPCQHALLARLRTAGPGVWVVTAARGRGKSALAGMLAAQAPTRCLLTAPSRQAAATLSRWAGEALPFMAPDALLAACRQQAPDVDWLLVDEAAAIPAPLLHALIRHFPRVLLTTTVQGYEGTGRGFLLKFCAELPLWHDLRLTSPIRWAEHDPLERLLDRVLLMGEETAPAAAAPAPPPTLITVAQSDWLARPALLASFYGLLSAAHYRTTPLDLRRLLDAPGQHFIAACQGENVCGALWLVEEGGLAEPLAREVWAGRRRPRGNLIAQSLAAHGGQWRAPLLRSRRISRIAVQPGLRRQGLGQRLVAEQVARAAASGLDALSVSFGYTPALWAFWQRCGFQLARIGTQREASSGCYAAMALLPLSAAGEALAHEAGRRLARDWPWQPASRELDLTLASGDQGFDQEDWRELAGFAFAHRPLEASLGALQRLLRHSALPLPALRAHLQQGITPPLLAQQLALAGRKALLARWREETATALTALDNAQCQQWQMWAAGD